MVRDVVVMKTNDFPEWSMNSMTRKARFKYNQICISNDTD